MSSRVINKSTAGIAAIALALLLAGCGGGDSSDDATATASAGKSDHSNAKTPDRGNGNGQSSNNGKDDDSATDDEPVDQTATLSWTAPGTRVNGESIDLSELQEYEIVYGQNPDTLDQSVIVVADGSMTHTIENLAEGDWYFAIRVIDQNGLSSDLSSVVSKTI